MLLPETLDNVSVESDDEYDLFIASCGYESRATAIARNVSSRAKRKLAPGFETNRELRYEDNQRWFRGNGVETDDVGDARFRAIVDAELRGLGSGRACPTFCVDVSCMNRLRLAHVVDAIREAPLATIEVSFFYSIAEFDPPSTELVPTVVIDPVTPQFSGWTLNPDYPPAVVLGLGYETNKALGVVEHLEVDTAAWAFLPVSPITEYLEWVSEANKDLLALTHANGRTIYYDLMDPVSSFHQLSSLVSGLVSSFNPIVVPFGPKMFSILSLLVATQFEQVGLWRVSSTPLTPAIDRRPSRYSVGIRVMFRRAENGAR